MKKFTFFFLFAVLCLASSCGDDDGATPDNPSIIILGEGTDQFKLGDILSTAVAELGTPDATASIGSTTQVSYFAEGIAFKVAATSMDDPMTFPIQEIFLTEGFDGKTDQDIGIGSTKAEVKAAYGEPTEEAFFGDEYHDLGGRFDYSDEDIVEDIDILIF